MAWKAGILGLGRGRCFVDVLRQMPDVQVTAVCDSSAERMARFAERSTQGTLFTRYDDLLASDVDIIVVASDAPQHCAHAIAALQADKHVISEVPAVWTVDEAVRLVKQVRRSKGQYFLAENCNYWHFVEVWREWAAAGRLGKIIYAEAEYVHDVRDRMGNAAGQTWRGKMPPIQYCTHSLGPLLKIMGGRCVRVAGMSTGVNVAPETGAIDMEVALVEHDSGAVIKVLCGFAVEREPSHHYYVLYGTHGSVEKSRFNYQTYAHLKDSPEYTRMALTPFTENHPDAPQGAHAGGHGTCEYYMLRDFLDALNANRRPSLGIDEALAMTLPGICAHQSAQQGGRSVEIPDLSREV